MRDGERGKRGEGEIPYKVLSSSVRTGVIKRLGRAPYEDVLQQMQSFTGMRDADTQDELWLVEHPPVYTLGVAARPEHLPRTDNGIPVVRSDRGGQITYHGPGQVVAYTLLDLRRGGLTVRSLVRALENAVIELLADHGIRAEGRKDAPGVYVDGAKIAALGLRIRNGCCYHGLSLNVDMDLTPFDVINPCGYSGLPVTQSRTLGMVQDADAVAGLLAPKLMFHLAYAHA